MRLALCARGQCSRPASCGLGGPAPVAVAVAVAAAAGGLHTEGDKAFVEFLGDEIKEEKKI